MGIQKPINGFLRCFVTCCYVGYLPYAPGTWASVLGCALLFFLPALAQSLIFMVLLIVTSVVAVNLFKYEGRDPGYIVIDELAGMCLTMAGHRITPVNIVIGFVCFRFFDIVKPWPIKRMEEFRGGYGIVADDLAAGLFSSAILFLAGRLL